MATKSAEVVSRTAAPQSCPTPWALGMSRYMEGVAAADEIRHVLRDGSASSQRPFTRGRSRQEHQGQSESTGGRLEGPLLALRMEREEAWKCGQALEAEKGEETDSSRKECNPSTRRDPQVHMRLLTF